MGRSRAPAAVIRDMLSLTFATGKRAKRWTISVATFRCRSRILKPTDMRYPSRCSGNETVAVLAIALRPKVLEAEQLGGIFHQDAPARFFVRRPVREQIEQQGIVRLGAALGGM